MFQSRYRAASHFRFGCFVRCVGVAYRFNLVIERLLISGLEPDAPFDERSCFNLVIERLLISGCGGFVGSTGSVLSFNLVIERLLISGPITVFTRVNAIMFQSRYRAASHFRYPKCHRCENGQGFQSRYRAASHFRSAARFGNSRGVVQRFNLVIERLLISGSRCD